MLYCPSEDLRYAYSAGEIKARENKFLTRHDFEQLISSGSPDEISTILSEAGYQVPQRAEEILLNIEGFLALNLNQAYKTMNSLSYHPQISSLFIMRYDFRNFAVLLKNKLFPETFLNKGITEEETLVNLGLHGLDKLRQSFEKKNYEIYPEEAADIFVKVEKKIDKESFEGIDRILNREFYAFGLDLSRSNSFCRYILRVFIDFFNLKGCLRLKRIKEGDISLCERFLIDGGRISKSDFIDFFTGRLGLGRLALRYSYQKVISKEEDLEWLEKKCDDFLMGVLKEAKFTFIGLETVIVYLLVKELEIKNIRLVLQGKAAALEEKDLTSYLRMTYV